VLRVARGLRCCGATVSGGLRVDETAACVRLRVSSVPDTENNAARLAAAKHLLESHLRRPIVIESAAAAMSIHATRLAYSSARLAIRKAPDFRRPA
jgi:hypothetical protein